MAVVAGAGGAFAWTAGGLTATSVEILEFTYTLDIELLVIPPKLGEIFKRHDLGAGAMTGSANFRAASGAAITPPFATIATELAAWPAEFLGGLLTLTYETFATIAFQAVIHNVSFPRRAMAFNEGTFSFANKDGIVTMGSWAAA